jgi:hypothetical protein
MSEPLRESGSVVVVDVVVYVAVAVAVAGVITIGHSFRLQSRD